MDRISGILGTARPRLKRTHEVTFKNCFGAVAGYVDGKIFISSGRFGVALKLPAPTVTRLLKESAVRHLKYFPNGRVKRDYVVLPKRILEDPARLKRLLDQSIRFATHQQGTHAPSRTLIAPDRPRR